MTTSWDNLLRRAEHAEAEVERLRAENAKLRAQLSTVRVMCRDAMDDWSEGQAVLGENILDAIGAAK